MIDGYAAVLLDVVGSRARPDRAVLQRRLEEELTRLEDDVDALEPIRITVGDELQGTFATVATAIGAVVRLRLALTADAELRAGIGWGAIVVRDPDRAPLAQDGPAWWAARAALDEVDHATVRTSYSARMMLHMADHTTAPTRAPGLPPARTHVDGPPEVLNALLAMFDRALATTDAIEARIVLGELRGRRRAELADDVGLTASAVSQRRTRNHLRELVVAVRRLEAAP